ncbi:spermidine/putrescine ABC transporter ATP-binding protein [Oenococcus oeni S25]|uniref:ABC transporter permease n=1 Tax=Oenococcus oeni TaxID=1247 RepID=UPI00050E8F6D|nr:ABC transporter permease [Oenococcus oeni]KGO16064.1 spermidine/putrescine ABC transporter ATP-binding protein [Oenococcus oeni X2L]KGH56226.1 spermidine/putrescine ABC transporter ATP-binding protein [Oenococcus oeni S22]KGH70202.1 spermidine/putrescine ABC transporter ATP-binding protein [Oenococcus oeni S25]KGH79951.1 spermidine/putrescine ABC transporter ATP-binding protein [Oenococcus oeni IOEB_0607]KGH88645.1 spermidine/putrescine ABC transporter ATP-binding protein [Oenococcus oeni I
MTTNKHLLTKIIGIVTIVFLVFPLILIVVTSFGTEPTISFPIKGSTFAWYANIFSQDSFTQGFITSVVIALLASLASALVGLPAAYALTRGETKFSHFLESVFLAPVMVPEVVLGFSLYSSLVIYARFPLFLSLLFGHFLICMPYTIRLLIGGLEQFDSSIEEASWVLGTSRLSGFFKMVLPNISTSIISGFLLSFINSFNNIPVSVFLSGANVNMLPTSILNYLQNNYDPTVSAILTCLMLLTLIFMLMAEKKLGLKSLIN